MAFTLISVANGTNATTLASGGTQTYSALTLGTTSNLASTFVAVAIAAGRFGNGSGITVNTCTIGATSLYQMDNGSFLDAVAATQYGVVMYGGWITTAPSTNALSVNWTNNTGGTTQLSVCAMSFTGTASTTTTSASVALRSAGGLIDGGTFTTAGTWAASASITTSGGVTTVGGITNNNVLIAGQQVYITNSTVITTGSYTIVGSTATSISFLGTFSGTETATVTYYTNTFGNGYGGSNNFDFYNPGFVTGINPGLTAPYATTVPTSYGSQKQPWVAAYITSDTFGVSQFRSSAALITIDTSGNVTSAGSATGTIVTTGAISSTATASSGVIFTPNGNMVFSYTGISGTTLTGCTVATAPSSNIVCPQYVQLHIPSLTGHGIVGVLPTASATSSASSGLANGDSSPTVSSLNSFPAVAMASPAANRLVMFGGYNAGGAKITTAVGALRIGTGTASGRGLLYTFVPATRTQTDLASANQIQASRGLRAVNRKKSANATQVVAATVTRRMSLNRLGQAVSVYAIGSTKRITRVRQALAGLIGIASALVSVLHIIPHPGTVKVGVKSPSVEVDTKL